jgi:chromosomal replication initiator protein
MGYPIVESIKSLLPLVDEMIVGVGQSDDQTKAVIEGIGDPKLKLFDSIWNKSKTTGGLILSEKTKHARNFLGTDVLSFIAEHITGNVRELEGIANLILCHTEIKKEPMSVPEVKQLIKNHIKEKVVKKPEEVIDTVAKYYNIPTANLTGKTRRQDVVYPRQIAIFLLREVYGKSYQIIGEKLGGRDHTTVMHSYEKIKVDKEQNPQINKEIEEIRQILA